MIEEFFARSRARSRAGTAGRRMTHLAFTPRRLVASRTPRCPADRAAGIEEHPARRYMLSRCVVRCGSSRSAGRTTTRTWPSSPAFRDRAIAGGDPPAVSLDALFHRGSGIHRDDTGRPADAVTYDFEVTASKYLHACRRRRCRWSSVLRHLSSPGAARGSGSSRSVGSGGPYQLPSPSGMSA